MRDWLARQRPQMEYLCPFLTPRFDEARLTLERLVEERLPQVVHVMGSSLGGYWATYLAEKYNLRAVLINPLVQPRRLGNEFIGQELHNYHTDDVYVLEQRHVEALLEADTPVIKHPENYWLLVQSGDETLDYRLAVEKYAGCRQTVEEGGDHSFQGFERYIPEVIDFLEQA